MSDKHSDKSFRDLRVIDLVSAEAKVHGHAATRLENALRTASRSGGMPFETVGEYLDQGKDAEHFLLRLPNIGKTSISCLRELLSRHGAADIRISDKESPKSFRDLRVIDLVSDEAKVYGGAATRLENVLRTASRSGGMPFETVGEYLDQGKDAERFLLGLPNVGMRVISYLREIVSGSGAGLDESISPHSDNPDHERIDTPATPDRPDRGCIDDLAKRNPGVFDPLVDGFETLSKAERVLRVRVATKLLEDPRAQDICRSRVQGQTLDAIGKRYKLSRERVRQIEDRYKKHFTDTSAPDWAPRAVRILASLSGMPTRLPDNQALAKCHPKLQSALRKAFYAKKKFPGALKPRQRYVIAKKLGLDHEAELASFKGWTVERVIHDVRKFAAQIGSPGVMPLYVHIRDKGRADLRGAITRFGGFAKIARLAGLKLQGRRRTYAEDGSRRYWTEERIRDFLHRVAREEGHPGVMPTPSECVKHAPNSNSILTILRGYGEATSWLETSRRHGLKSNYETKITLKFVRDFVKSLGDALYSLSPSEIYVLFEQAGIAKAGKRIRMHRSFDNLVSALQSGYLPREEIDRWINRGKGELVEALLDPRVESVDEAFAIVGRPAQAADNKKRSRAFEEKDYRENVDARLPVPAAVDTLRSLSVATDLLREVSSDSEAVQFLIAKAAGKLWQRCFENEAVALAEARAHHGNVHSEAARNAFLEEYTRSRQLPLPNGYSFKDAKGVSRDPKLMQRLIAYKTLRDGRVLNLSGTGTGKTLSAVLASRVCGARVTVIACPNITVSGWHETIRSAFPSSDVSERTWTPSWSDDDWPRYLVVNHELFQDRFEGKIKRFIDANAVDFVVIDELHHVKQRDERSESQRRRLVNGLITDVPEGRPKPRVLGMSATPIINNLQEGKSLVELVSSLHHDDIGTKADVSNCMKLYQKFTTMGFRMMPKYSTDRIPQIHPVDCTPYLEDLVALGARPHPQQVEATLVRARWPVIKRCLKPKTVIFTEYIKDIVPYLVPLVGATGLSVGIYTGDEKLATELGYKDMLDQFMRGELQVLIASIKTVGTGVDGLQYVCSNIIFATLPWTNTDYEQAIGRFDREGFIFPKLDIHIPKTYATLSDGQRWSWCERKLARLENKRGIARAAVDGEIPDAANILTPEKATGYWMEWLRRLTDEGMIEFERRGIRVPLDETDRAEVARRFASYGDFANLNSRWNRAHSSETNRRLQENPEEWCYYHTRMIELERGWQLLPRAECIKHLSENLPRGSVIGDFGCGRAQLAEELRAIHTVHSIDHVAINRNVTACDMARTPLEADVLDAAVFSLSLMGSNVADYIREAYRTLKLGGQLLIYHPAEHNDRQRFVSGLEGFGFAVVKHGQIYKWHYVWAIKKGSQSAGSHEIRF